MTQTLTLLTWPDYISPRTLEQFESEYGVNCQLEVVPSAAELIERMQTSNPGVDILVPPDYAVRELNAQGRLLQLDHSKLPNLQHLEPRFYRGRAHDSESLVSVIKDWGTTGFMYRTDRIDEKLHSWADFWSFAERVSGCVTVLDSPGEVIGAALKMHGYSYNASSPEELNAAREDLLRLRPHLLMFETNYKPLLSSGKVSLSLGWNGDAAALISQGVPILYVVPSEGSQIWEDDWAIAVDASHPNLAHRFINFVLRPDIAAQEAHYTCYATGNHSAWMSLDEEIRNDPATYPSQEILEKLEAGRPLDAEGQKARDELWKEVRGA